MARKGVKPSKMPPPKKAPAKGVAMKPGKSGSAFASKMEKEDMPV